MNPCRDQRRTGRVRAAVGLCVAVLLSGCGHPAAADPEDTEKPAPTTTEVLRQDLTTRDEFAGRLEYADPTPLVAGRDGTLTWIPEEGTVVRRGKVVAEIDGVATRLLIGDKPGWRRLAVGEPDGPDIAQLEDNLVALGYAERDMLPDEWFDWRTRAAVYRWQDDLELAQTGDVEPGDVVFLPSAARIGEVAASQGTPVGAGQPLATVTGTEQVVTVDLDVADRDRMPEGSSVVVVLPDRTEVDATVRSVGRVASARGESAENPTVPVEIELAGSAGQAHELDAAPVMVHVERVLAREALIVPVGALVARAGSGGYAVERVTTAGTELVAVEPGRFADAVVEITGDIAEGDRVVIP